MQLNGASGLRAGKRQRKRVQELAAAKAAHYDGICLARWRRISVRGRFCMLPEHGESPYKIVIAATVSVICSAGYPTGYSPKPPLGMNYVAEVSFAQYSGVRCFTVSSGNPSQTSASNLGP
jgi:hypothetical protein